MSDLVLRARTAAEKVYGTQFFNEEIEAAIAVALEEAAGVVENALLFAEDRSDYRKGIDIAAAIRALGKA